jgi:hypothetical protein
MNPNQKLLKNEGELIEDPCRVVRKLNYPTITRQDISYALSLISQFLGAPRIPH